MRKTGETKGRSGGLKIRPTRERSLATHRGGEKKPSYEKREDIQRGYSGKLKGKLKGADTRS